MRVPITIYKNSALANVLSIGGTVLWVIGLSLLFGRQAVGAILILIGVGLCFWAGKISEKKADLLEQSTLRIIESFKKEISELKTEEIIRRIHNSEQYSPEYRVACKFVLNERNVDLSNGTQEQNPFDTIGMDKSPLQPEKRELLETQINKARKKSRVLAVLMIVFTVVYIVGLLFMAVSANMAVEKEYTSFDRNGDTGIYSAVHAAQLIPVYQTYMENTKTGTKNYSNSEYYCIYFDIDGKHGMVKLDKGAYTDESVKKLIDYGTEITDAAPEPVWLYGNTKTIPTDLIMGLMKEVGFQNFTEFDLGSVCLDAKLTPQKENNALSVFAFLTMELGTLAFLVVLIMFFVNRRKKKNLEKALLADKSYIEADGSE